METSGNHSEEQGQTNKQQHGLRRRLRKRWVLRTILVLAPLATKVVELVIVVIRTLK